MLYGIRISESNPELPQWCFEPFQPGVDILSFVCLSTWSAITCRLHWLFLLSYVSEKDEGRPLTNQRQQLLIQGIHHSQVNQICLNLTSNHHSQGRHQRHLNINHQLTRAAASTVEWLLLALTRFLSYQTVQLCSHSCLECRAMNIVSVFVLCVMFVVLLAVALDSAVYLHWNRIDLNTLSLSQACILFSLGRSST